MHKLPTFINTAASLFLLFASPVTLAAELLIIDESLDTLPTGFELWTYASDNATADLQIGSLGASSGLIFDGSWDVPANGTEDALGLMYPVAGYHLNPGDIGGITSVHWTLDTEVISTTMVAPDQGVFAQLYIYQDQGDGSYLTFVDFGQFNVTGQSISFDITATESDFGPSGARPDFSASGGLLAFALQIGARYPRTNNPAAFFVDGRMTAKNWTVSVTGGGGIFSDSFESLTPNVNTEENSIKLVNKEDCLCPAPVPLPARPNN